MVRMRRVEHEQCQLTDERCESGWEWEAVDLGLMLDLVYIVLSVNL
jgi:hypothetical protein